MSSDGLVRISMGRDGGPWGAVATNDPLQCSQYPSRGTTTPVQSSLHALVLWPLQQEGDPGRHHTTALSLSSSSAQNWSLCHQSCSPGLELLLHLDAASTFSSFLIGTLSLCLLAPARALPDKWAGEWEQTNDGTTRVAPIALIGVTLSVGCLAPTIITMILVKITVPLMMETE